VAGSRTGGEERSRRGTSKASDQQATAEAEEAHKPLSGGNDDEASPDHHQFPVPLVAAQGQTSPDPHDPENADRLREGAGRKRHESVERAFDRKAGRCRKAEGRHGEDQGAREVGEQSAQVTCGGHRFTPGKDLEGDLGEIPHPALSRRRAKACSVHARKPKKPWAVPPEEAQVGEAPRGAARTPAQREDVVMRRCPRAHGSPWQVDGVSRGDGTAHCVQGAIMEERWPPQALERVIALSSGLAGATEAVANRVHARRIERRPVHASKTRLGAEEGGQPRPELVSRLDAVVEPSDRERVERWRNARVSLGRRGHGRVGREVRPSRVTITR